MSISKKAVAYELNATGAYTLGFTLNSGDVFFFYNNTVGASTVNGLSVPANSGKTFVVLSGVLRSL